MFFPDQNNLIRIQSVLEMDWDRSEAEVAPRPYHALSCRLQGDCKITDSTHCDYLRTGDVLCMPADTPYTIRSGSERIIVIHFDMTGDFPKSFSAFSIEGLQEQFEKILRIWNEKKPGYYLRAMSVLYRIFGELSRQFEPESYTPAYLRIKPVVDRIHSSFKDPALTVQSLCALAGMSDTMFRRLFLEVCGTTPLRYINRLRTDYAEELLNEGIYTVEQVALKAGFSDPKYFSTVFKSYKKLPPSCVKNPKKALDKD